MQVVGGGSFIYALIFTSLTLWGRLSAFTPSNSLPGPTLSIKQRLKDSVVLVCRAPEGQHGVVFMLYRVTEKMDTQVPQSDSNEVQFTVKMKDLDADQRNLFCCLYKTQELFYSAFSPYLQLNNQIDASPTRPSLPPPVLSVEPSTGVVRLGDTLSFRCTIPTHLPQPQSNKPMTFLLLRMEEPTGATSVVVHQQENQEVSLNQNPEPQPGVFTVGPMRGGEQGRYTCVYQIYKRRASVNSTVSNEVQVTMADLLPMPTLVLQQHTDVWHLLCTGSPAYPGAVFSLYLADKELPVATQHSKVLQHHAIFPIPVQDTPVTLYQCQYGMLLGNKWSDSERSLSLAVTKGIPAPPSSSGVDWPLVLGSLSAVVLFLSSLAVVIVMVHRKVKAAAKEKKKREEAQFWTQLHARDHIVDLTLRRTSFTSQEWASRDSAAASRSPPWNSHSTFTMPAY